MRIHLIPAIGKIKLKNLTVEHVQRFINAKDKAGFASRTIQCMRTCLNNALCQAMRNGYIARNVTQSVIMPKIETSERRLLTPHEQQLIIRALEREYNGFMVLFGLFTGLRRGELMAVRWCDVDLTNNTLSVKQNLQRVHGEDGKTRLTVGTPKTKSSYRTIPLLSRIADGLRKHYKRQQIDREIAGELWEENDLIFCNKLGRPQDLSTLQTILDRITEIINIPHVNTHALRHAFATRALEQGVDLKAVSTMLGHSGIRVTADIYTHASIEHLNSEMQKLNPLMGDYVDF